jgi:hypothetical protein
MGRGVPSRYAAAALALVTCGPAAAAAQRPQTRAGFWISAGVGAGFADFGCKTVPTQPTVPSPSRGCSFSSEMTGLGPTVRVRLGGVFSPRVIFGLQGAIWTKSDAGIRSRAAIFGTCLYLYPREGSGFFIGGTTGHTVYSADDGTDKMASNGFGFLAGVGYDVRIGPNVSLTPALNVSLGGLGNWTVNNTKGGSTFRQSLIEIGVGLTYH